METKFIEILERLSPKLRAIAHRMNGRSTYFSDEDLYQEAIVNLWVLYENGFLGDKTDSYILQGCYFRLKNYLRTTLDKASIVSLDSVICGNYGTIEDTLVRDNKEEYNDIKSKLVTEDLLLKAFNARERMIIRLSVEGLTLREIGRRLGISHVMVVKLKAVIKDKYLRFNSSCTKNSGNN